MGTAWNSYCGGHRVFYLYGVLSMAEKKRFDYRHIICILITLGFAACTVFVFPSALGRIVEGGRDFGLSVAYYFCELFQIPHNITPTINNLPDTGGLFPAVPIAEDWEQFKADFFAYWRLWANGDNFLSYLSFLGDLLYSFCILILLLTPVVIVIIIL